jgi:nucleoside-diphosphate-sugar epimerase
MCLNERSDHDELLPDSTPRLLIAGGAGQALSTVVLTLGRRDYDVTVIGRRPLSPLQHTTLLACDNVRYARMDVFAPGSQAQLGELAADADIFVMGAEPHVVADAAELEAAIEGVECVYATLRDAGYTTAANDVRRRARQWPKRIVRIGSPPAELPSRGISRSGFVEDATSLEELKCRAIEDTNWQNPYFQGKVRCAIAAHEAVDDGLDLVTAAPTSVISWAGDWGEHEPIVLLRNALAEDRPPFIPSTLTNVVPGDVFACGIMLVAVAGATGESYQLAGVDIETAECAKVLLASIGEVPPPPRTLSPEELDHQVRLLNGESLRRTARDVLDYGGRAVANVGLMWANAFSLGMLTPLVVTKIATDAVAGGASAVRNTYDNAVTTTLGVLGIESWQIALLAEMQARSADKVRALNPAVARTPVAAFAYPDAAEMARQLLPALQRQAEWLQTRGLLPRSAR